jgi:hypothetical protein
MKYRDFIEKCVCTLSLSVIIILLLIISSLKCCSQTLMPNDGFWYEWESDYGIIYDDGYTQKYANNGLGALTIYPASVGYTTINFIFMDIEYQPNCQYDYLEVYHGSTFDSLIGRFCGNTLPLTISSSDTSKALTLLWSTDNTVRKQGFILEVMSMGGPLPIILNSFVAEPYYGNVQVEWEVASQVNNDYFSLYRSIDCLSWELVETMRGAGNYNANISYTLLDRNPYTGISYYKLTQTDYDGTIETFNPIAVVMKEVTKKIWKIFNLRGQEVGPEYRGPVIDIYYDNTSHKRIQ